MTIFHPAKNKRSKKEKKAKRRKLYPLLCAVDVFAIFAMLHACCVNVCVCWLSSPNLPPPKECYTVAKRTQHTRTPHIPI